MKWKLVYTLTLCLLIVFIITIISVNYKFVAISSPLKNILINLGIVQADWINIRPNIILNTMQKTGSEYVAAALRDGLDYERVHISSVYLIQDNRIHSDLKDFFDVKGLVAKQHLRAVLPVQHRVNDVLDLTDLRNYTDRLVLHLRDPRQILLSWVHHINKYPEYADHDLFPKPPENFYSLSLHDQIDWSIDNYLPNVIIWMSDWLAIKDREDKKWRGMKILVTTYDELIQDELKLYDRILAFYSIPTKYFKFIKPAKDSAVYFRKGDPNEWSEVFTPEQKLRIAAIVPDELLDRFGWKN